MSPCSEIVVTGASGFIAGHLVRAARERGLAVTALSRRTTRRRSVGVRSLPTSVDEYADHRPGENSVLIHLGEPAHVPAIDQLGARHVDEVTRCGQALIEAGYRRVIYASSATIYGDRDTHAHPALDPPSLGHKLYADAKVAVERIFLTHPQAVVARITNTYGPGMADSNIFSDILSQLGRKGPVHIREATPVREYLWVEDLAEGLLAMALGDARGVFNLSSGEGIDCAGLARTILRLAGEPNREVRAQGRARESILRLDVEATRVTFGWRPRTPLEQGINRLLAQRMA